MEEKTFSNKKAEEKAVIMPSKTNNAYIDVEFSKEQLKQLLIEAGMEARSAAGQATVLCKLSNIWNSEMLISHYVNSKSKIKATIMALLGANEEQIESSKSKRGHDTGSLIENIKLGLAVIPDIDAKLRAMEGNGQPLWDRIPKSQQSKYLKIAGKEEITEGELKCLILNSPTSKYGIPALMGEEYGNISLADVNTMIKKKRG